MTKKVVFFKPAAARRASAPHDAAEALATDTLGPGRRPAGALHRDEPAAAAFARAFASGSRTGADLADGIALFHREAAIAMRAPLERWFTGMARLASCRTPAQFVDMQARVADEALAGALADQARLADSWAKLARASAEILANRGR